MEKQNCTLWRLQSSNENDLLEPQRAHITVATGGAAQRASVSAVERHTQADAPTDKQVVRAPARVALRLRNLCAGKLSEMPQSLRANAPVCLMCQWQHAPWTRALGDIVWLCPLLLLR